MSINELVDLIKQFISVGFSMSVIVSFVSWSIMKVWRLFIDITHL